MAKDSQIFLNLLINLLNIDNIDNLQINYKLVSKVENDYKIYSFLSSYLLRAWWFI